MGIQNGADSGLMIDWKTLDNRQQKLPVCHELSDGTHEPITVLEAVVRNSGIYADSRKGRLSVFWGDQIFVPTAPFRYTPTHHVDIMCTLEEEPPTAKVWSDKGLDKYGVIAVSEGGDAAQVEKVDHATAMKMLKALGDIERAGPSLGSFSVGAKILEALCTEFKDELDKKDGKLDTGEHEHAWDRRRTSCPSSNYRLQSWHCAPIHELQQRSPLLDAVDSASGRVHCLDD